MVSFQIGKSYLYEREAGMCRLSLTLSLEGSQEHPCATHERSGSTKIKYTRLQAQPWSISALRATASHLKCLRDTCDLTRRPASLSATGGVGQGTEVLLAFLVWGEKKEEQEWVSAFSPPPNKSEFFLPLQCLEKERRKGSNRRVRRRARSMEEI